MGYTTIYGHITVDEQKEEETMSEKHHQVSAITPHNTPVTIQVEQSTTPDVHRPKVICSSSCRLFIVTCRSCSYL